MVLLDLTYIMKKAEIQYPVMRLVMGPVKGSFTY